MKKTTPQPSTSRQPSPTQPETDPTKPKTTKKVKKAGFRDAEKLVERIDIVPFDDAYKKREVMGSDERAIKAFYDNRIESYIKRKMELLMGTLGGKPPRRPSEIERVEKARQELKDLEENSHILYEIAPKYKNFSEIAKLENDIRELENEAFKIDSGDLIKKERKDFLLKESESKMPKAIAEKAKKSLLETGYKKKMEERNKKMPEIMNKIIEKKEQILAIRERAYEEYKKNPSANLLDTEWEKMYEEFQKINEKNRKKPEAKSTFKKDDEHVGIEQRMTSREISDDEKQVLQRQDLDEYVVQHEETKKLLSEDPNKISIIIRKNQQTEKLKQMVTSVLIEVAKQAQKGKSDDEILTHFSNLEEYKKFAKQHTSFVAGLASPEDTSIVYHVMKKILMDPVKFEKIKNEIEIQGGLDFDKKDKKNEEEFANHYLPRIKKMVAVRFVPELQRNYDLLNAIRIAEGMDINAKNGEMGPTLQRDPDSELHDMIRTIIEENLLISAYKEGSFIPLQYGNVQIKQDFEKQTKEKEELIKKIVEKGITSPIIANFLLNKEEGKEQLVPYQFNKGMRSVATNLIIDGQLTPENCDNVMSLLQFLWEIGPQQYSDKTAYCYERIWHNEHSQDKIKKLEELEKPKEPPEGASKEEKTQYEEKLKEYKALKKSNFLEHLDTKKTKEEMHNITSLWLAVADSLNKGDKTVAGRELTKEQNEKFLKLQEKLGKEKATMSKLMPSITTAYADHFFLEGLKEKGHGR